MLTAFRLILNGVLAALACGYALAADAPPPPNYQGLWWSSPSESESGWGINFAHQGDVIFATWFTYNAAGNGWWLSMSAIRTAEGTYAGQLVETSGPAFSAVPFDPARVTRTPVGSGTLSFRDQDNGTFTYDVRGLQQTKYITRDAFGPQPTCTYAAQPDLAGATNYQDLWWAAGGTESGWGINLAHQGDTIFATWFTYDAAGAPHWLSATAARIATNVYSGQLIRTRGPPFSAEPFDPARVTRTVAGTVTLTFAHGNAASFAYTLDGVSRTKSITRYQFAPPAGTRCGAPFRTLEPLSVVAVGDIADCDNGPASASAAARTAALVRDGDALVLALGDNAYESGSHAEYANCFDPTWGRFKERIRPIPGNHEYYTTGAAGYFDYFGAAAGPDRNGWYSFDQGGWHVIALNGMAGFAHDSAQYRWLLADLEGSRNSLCTIALVHFPPFNSGSTHGSSPEMKPAFAALHQAGVELVLSGHEHVYERFTPQDADGLADPARGVRQFVVGTGGATLMSFGTPLPNSEFRHAGSFGVLRLTLGRGTYGWSFVTVDGGAAIDAGSADCHR